MTSLGRVLFTFKTILSKLRNTEKHQQTTPQLLQINEGQITVEQGRLQRNNSHGGGHSSEKCSIRKTRTSQDSTTSFFLLLNHKEKAFLLWGWVSTGRLELSGDWTPNIFGDIQIPAGASPEPPAIADPALSEGLHGVWKFVPTSGILLLCETRDSGLKLRGSNPVCWIINYYSLWQKSMNQKISLGSFTDILIHDILSFTATWIVFNKTGQRQNQTISSRLIYVEQ